MKIRSRLLLSNLVFALLVVILGVLAVGSITAIDREYLELSNNAMPHQQTLQDVRFAASRMVSSTIEYCFLLERKTRGGGLEPKLLATENEQRHDSVVRLREAVARTDQLTALSPHPPSFQHVRRKSETLIESGDALVAASSDRSLRNLDELRERYEEEEIAFFQELDNAISFEKEFVSKKQGQLEQMAGQARQWILLIAVTIVLLATGVGFRVAQVIIGRVEQLRLAASRFAHQDEPEAIMLEGNDELRDLAETLNRMAGDLRQSRLEVANGRDFLTEIINSMADSLVVVDPNGNILIVNAATHAMLGYDDELTGLPFSMIMHDPPLTEVAERGILWNVEAEYRNKSGIAIPVAFSCSVLWNPDNSLRGFVCVALDISQIKEAETKLKRFADELQLNNEELRNFAYIVSHDLRAPLVNIKGFTGELQGQLQELYGRWAVDSLPPDDKIWLEQVFRPESDQALSFISSSVTRMEGLIAGLLKLSRYGHRELHPEPVDTGELFQHIISTLSHQLAERKTAVKVGAMPVVEVDRAALEQIFANLLDNAVKYLESERPGLVMVDAIKTDGGVTFRINDNGRGIAQPDMEKIFDIFRRAGRQDVPGEGMGLAYVRTLVKRLEGQIWCESTLGAGTTFFVTLPCTVVPGRTQG